MGRQRQSKRLPGEARATGIAPIVGRDSELAILTHALEDARSSRGRLVAIVGEAGMGKTRLLHEVVTRCAEGRCAVLWSPVIEDPALPPCHPWRLLLEACRHETGIEADPDLWGLAEPPKRPASPKRITQEESDRFRFFDSVTGTLVSASRDRPLAVVVDNLHLADDASLRLLEHFAQRTATQAIAVIVACRPPGSEGSGAFRRTVQSLARSPGFTSIDLRGLSQAQTGALLERIVSRKLSRPLVELVHDQTEGNPLFVSELGRELSRQIQEDPSLIDRERPHVRLPHGLGDLIAVRIEELRPACIRVLETASVLGREFDASLLARLPGRSAGGTETRSLRLLAEAERVRIVEAVPARPGFFRFAHALFREVLYARLSTVQRVTLHRHAARMLERFGGDPGERLSELAYHFFEAAPGGDVEKAIDYSNRAGLGARAIHAYDEASRHFERALEALSLEENDDPERHFELACSLGTAQLLAGRSEAASRTLLSACVLAQRHGWWTRLGTAAVSFQEARCRIGSSHTAARPLLETALANLPDTMKAERIRVLAALAMARLFEGETDASIGLAREALSLARGAELEEERFASLLALCWALEQVPDDRPEALELGREMLAMAERRRWDLEAAGGSLAILCNLGSLGRISELKEEVPRAEAIAQRTQDVRLATVVSGIRASVAILEGRWMDALTNAREALGRGDPREATGLEGSYAFQAFAIQRARTGLAGLRRFVDGFLEETSPVERWMPGTILVMADVGLTEQARAELDRLAKANFERLPGDDLLLLTLVYLAEASVILGERRHARALLRRLEPYQDQNICATGTVMLGAVSGILAKLAVVLGQGRQARRFFEHALEANASMGALPALAETQCEYAAFLQRSSRYGDDRRALNLLRESVKIAERLGMAPLASRAHALLRGEGLRREGLTEREREVLDLIASGASNQAIGKSLFVSPSTVATHIRSIFRKLGAENRTDAVARARDEGLLET